MTPQELKTSLSLLILGAELKVTYNDAGLYPHTFTITALDTREGRNDPRPSRRAFHISCSCPTTIDNTRLPVTRILSHLRDAANVKHAEASYYVLLRVRRWKHHWKHPSDHDDDRLQRLWWTIDDHDGRHHTNANSEFTVAVTRLQSDNRQDAEREFAAAYAYWAPLLDGCESVGYLDWAGRIDDEQLAERMTDFWAQRAKAFRGGDLPANELPPRHDHTMQINDHVRVGIRLDGIVRAIAPAEALHSKRHYRLQLTPTEFDAPNGRAIWIEESEVLAVIKNG